MTATLLEQLKPLADQGLVHSMSQRLSARSERITFALVPGRESAAVAALVDALLPGDEICLIFALPLERYQFARRTADGYEVKRAGHGSAGTWQSVTKPGAAAWLYEVADRNLELDPLAGAPLFVRPRRTGL